jgi:chromosome segregation ATPase
MEDFAAEHLDLNEVEDLYRTVKSRLQAMHQKMHEYKTSYAEMKKQLAQAINERNEIQKKYMENEALMSSMSRTIQILEDDIKQLTKVSHVISLERANTTLLAENNKLKLEVQSLKKSHATKPPSHDTRPFVSPISNPIYIETSNVAVIHDTDKNEDTKEDTHKEPQETDAEEAELEVYEKKIKGEVYFVSTASDMTVYEKLSDGSIGEPKGKLTKASGKLKVEWYTQ